MKKWYALQVLSNKEKTVKKTLSNLGYDVFLPIQKVDSKRKDRRRTIEKPLIPSYLFLNILQDEIWKIVGMNNIGKFVFFNGKPAPIPDYQIENLKAIEKEGLSYMIVDIHFEIGDKVEAEIGESIITGYIIESRGKRGFLVQLDHIGMNFKIDISKEELKKAL